MILHYFCLQYLLLNQIEAYGENNDFFVVKGEFGDTWKDSGKKLKVLNRKFYFNLKFWLASTRLLIVKLTDFRFYKSATEKIFTSDIRPKESLLYIF